MRLWAKSGGRTAFCGHQGFQRVRAVRETRYNKKGEVAKRQRGKEIREEWAIDSFPLHDKGRRGREPLKAVRSCKKLGRRTRKQPSPRKSKTPSKRDWVEHATKVKVPPGGISLLGKTQ